MGIEIPSEIKFQHFLSFTFPGIFLAIPLFLLINEKYIIVKFTEFNLEMLLLLLSGLAFIGTILGIIIDGIHHDIIEAIIFDSNPQVKYLDEYLPQIRKKTRKKLDLDTIIKLEGHLLEGSYLYSEFYCNTFISLFLAGILIPYYLYYCNGSVDFYSTCSIGFIILIKIGRAHV